MTHEEARDELEHQMRSHLASMEARMRVVMAHDGLGKEHIDWYFRDVWWPDVEVHLSALWPAAERIINGETLH